jgi:hypothetical protein
MVNEMFPPKNILFPTDFSERSAAVAPMVVGFARRFNANLTLLHIAPLFPDRSPAERRFTMDTFATVELAGLVAERMISVSRPTSSPNAPGHGVPTWL